MAVDGRAAMPATIPREHSVQRTWIGVAISGSRCDLRSLGQRQDDDSKDQIVAISQL